MIRGILALFSSKVIFNPFVLAGISFGFFLNSTNEPQDLFLEFKNVQTYIIILFLSVIYNVFIKKHLKLGGREIDWEQTIIATIGSFAKFFISCYLTISFIYFLFF